MNKIELLQKKIDLEYQKVVNKCVRESMKEAAESGDIDLLTYLLDKENTLFNPELHSKYNLINILKSSVQYSHLNIVEHILMRFPALKSEANDLSELFIQACKQGNLDIMDLLFFYAPNIDIEIGFEWACYEGNVAAIDYLLKSNHYRSAFDPYNNNESCITFACQEDKLEAVQYLMTTQYLPRPFNVNAVDDDGDTPFHLAIINHSYSVISYLLSLRGNTHLILNLKQYDFDTIATIGDHTVISAYMAHIAYYHPLEYLEMHDMFKIHCEANNNMDLYHTTMQNIESDKMNHGIESEMTILV